MKTKKIHISLNYLKRFIYENYKIDWTIKDINKTDITVTQNESINSNNLRVVENVNQRVIYEGIQEHVNLELILTGSKIKENITLDKYIEHYSLTYHFILILSLGSFYMFDQNLIESSNIEIEINEIKKGEYELRIIPDNEWLQSDERIYPVTIDPTIIISSNGSSPLSDRYTYGSSYNESTNYIKTGQTSSYTYRSYIELNLQDVVNKPVITYANLELDVYSSYNYCDNDCQVNLREVKSSIDYDNINGSSTNITEPEVVDYVMVNNSYTNTIPNYPKTTFMWDITKLIQKWKYNDQSLGILELSDANNVTDEYVWYDSSEYSSGIKPKITIGYVEQTGLNDYWTYHSQSAGNAGVGYVNDYTGNLTFIHGDYAPLGELFSFGISHVYNLDRRDTNYGYGNGWDINLNTYIDYDNDAEQYYYQDADGSKVYFYNLPSCDDPTYYVWDSCYIAEDGSRQTFKVESQDLTTFTYYIKTPDGIETSYTETNSIDTQTKVIKYSDTKTNQWYQVYFDGISNIITRVEDNAGNRAIFSYDTSGNLEKITINRKNEDNLLKLYKEEIHFEYTNNNLTNITHFYVDPDTQGLVSEDDNVFIYDSDDRLIDAKNTFDNGLHYSYVSPTRDQVSKVELYSNDSGVKEYISKVDINYQFKQTHFTNESNDQVIYTFDNYGHTINIVDNKGNAQFYKYFDLYNHLPENPELVNWNLNHKLIHVSSPQKNNFSTSSVNYSDDRINLLTNPSFETDTTGWTRNGMYRSSSSSSPLYQDFLGHYSMKVVGDSTTTRSISQTFDVEGLSGDKYVFGGWAKGYTQPNNFQSDKQFRISVTLNEYYTGLVCYYDPQTFSQICEPGVIYEPKTYYLDFNTDIDSWQYLMNEIKTNRDYDQITFTVEYQGEGTMYFDGLQLYKEEFGTGYTYVGQNDPNDQTKSGNLERIDYPGYQNDVHYSYDGDNNLDKITGVDGTVTDIDITNDLVDTITKNNVKIDFDYDASKNVNGITFGDTTDKYFKLSTNYAYNNQFIDKTTNLYGYEINYGYDPVTGLLKQLSYASSNGTDVTTSYNYDAYGRLIEVNQDNNSQNEYVYEEGKLKRIIINGFYYEFHYDNFDRISEVWVNNQKLMSYEFYTETDDSGTTYHNGQLKNQQYGNGNIINFIYDDEDRITDINYNGVTRFHYEYDYAGRISLYEDKRTGDQFTYLYGINGRLKSVVDQNNNTITLNYNNKGQLSDYDTTIDGELTKTDFYYYTYGAFDGMYNKTTFTVDGKTITKDYLYDNDSLKRLNTIALSISGTTINKTITYDDQNVVNGNASTRIKTINYDINDLSYEYTYDNLGNITNLIVSENGITLEKYHYEYDDLNQLVREDTDLEGTNNDFTKVYQYDSNGNIIARIERNTVSEETTDTLLNSTEGKVSYVYDSTWKDQLSSYNGTSISYDNIGNPISIGSTITLEWEGRQLVKYVDTSQDLKIKYKYNDKGYRIKKIITQNNVMTTTNYFLDGDKVLKETKSNGTEIKYFYDVDNTVTGFSYNNNIYLYVRNLQGDITKIVDESGNIVVEYNYDAWGNIVSQTDDSLAKINPYRYRGYRYDEENKYYYLNSRYYNPEMGKFINMDGITGQIGDILGHNLYAYTENNPVMYSDPSGYCLRAATLDSFGDPREGGCGSGSVSLTTIVLGLAIVGSAIDWDSLARDIEDVVSNFSLSRSRTSYNSASPEHHIVPRGNFSIRNKDIRDKLRESQDILKEVGIHIDSSHNKITVPYNLHIHMHTNNYISHVWEYLNEAYIIGAPTGINRARVIQALFALKIEISSGVIVMYM